MVGQGIERLRDEGVVSSDPKQLFWVAGAAPIIHRIFSGKKFAGNFVSSQSCLRMNRFEQVGTGNHHIFFEMLGHFSISKFRAQAAREWTIATALDYLVNVAYINPASIRISCHPDDQGTIRTWNDFGYNMGVITIVSDKHTATFYPGLFGYRTKIGIQNKSGLLSFWDLVFIDKTIDGVETPMTFVDSGMSLDRLHMASSGYEDSYATSNWKALCAECTLQLPAGTEKSVTRRLADVGRAASVLIMSGIKSGSKGREYVLRKLIREICSILYLAGNNSSIVGLTNLLYEDTCLRFERNLQVIEYKDVVESFRSESETFSKSLSRAMRQRDKFLALHGTLSDEDVRVLTESFGLPKKLIGKSDE